MLAKLLALVATLTGNPGPALAVVAAAVAASYVAVFLAWCAWHFLQDVLDERGEHPADRDLRHVERAAYAEHRAAGRGPR